MAASASTSTSASASAPTSTSAPVYDVFLNHRGPDVKNTLASHIYHRLLPYGLRVFLDQQELQPGEALTPQIEEAIASSSVQVAIFSTRYAESNWCLDELVRMLLESKRSGATIIPVFFNVQPSDLRWPDKGGYAQSLLTHESKGRYNKETLADWRAALAEVSHISGFELKSCNGDEGKLVEKVVQQAMKKVKKPPLQVAVHPTGLDNLLNDFERKVLLQQQHRGQAKVVGIVGLGGVGKTTMAKEFFNRKRSSYGRSSFLAEVRGLQVPLELKELRVPSKLFLLPRSIGQLKHLEIIELHFRGSSLPEEFFDLHSLKHLKLTLTASEMKSLPDSLGKLTNLRHIDLSRCCYLQTLPASFGNLTKLEHLNLSGCNKIEVLPLQVTHQRSLVELLLESEELKALPSAIGDLSNLKFLKLKCSLLEILPPSLCNLTNLESFDIQFCPRLKCSPYSIGEFKQFMSRSEDYRGRNRRTAWNRIKRLSGIECLPVGARELNNTEILNVLCPRQSFATDFPIREVSLASGEKVHKCMVRLERSESPDTRTTHISFGDKYEGASSILVTSAYHHPFL